MSYSIAQRVELIAGTLALEVCLGAIIWGFATNVRDSSPGSIIMEGQPEIVLDDSIGVTGIRDLTTAKLRFLGLIVLAGGSVAGGATLHVYRHQRWASVGIWVGALVVFGCGVATVRTLGMPLFFAASLSFVAALASSVSTVSGGVTPANVQRG